MVVATVEPRATHSCAVVEEGHLTFEQCREHGTTQQVWRHAKLSQVVEEVRTDRGTVVATQLAKVGLAVERLVAPSTQVTAFQAVVAHKQQVAPHLETEPQVRLRQVEPEGRVARCTAVAVVAAATTAVAAEMVTAVTSGPLEVVAVRHFLLRQAASTRASCTRKDSTTETVSSP